MKNPIRLHIGKRTDGIGYPAHLNFYRSGGWSLKIGALHVRVFERGNATQNRVSLQFSRTFWIKLFGHNTIQIVG